MLIKEIKNKREEEMCCLVLAAATKVSFGNVMGGGKPGHEIGCYLV